MAIHRRNMQEATIWLLILLRAYVGIFEWFASLGFKGTSNKNTVMAPTITALLHRLRTSIKTLPPVVRHNAPPNVLIILTLLQKLALFPSARTENLTLSVPSKGATVVRLIKTLSHFSALSPVFLSPPHAFLSTAIVGYSSTLNMEAVFSTVNVVQNYYKTLSYTRL
jgi:hypothetical protein